MRRHKRSTWLFSALFFFFFALQYNEAYSQVKGCKDPTATNYNPSATIADSTCTYTTTNYTPPIIADSISDVLPETSGLQMAGNYLWSFNDGGGAAAIYRIDTLTNALLQTVNLGGASNIDWEDIAFDGTSFYVGDFGNNANGARTNLKIYKFNLSDIPAYTGNPTVTIPSWAVRVIHFSYSDQVPVTATTPNNTKYDCEAMIVDGAKIHLFTKNWVNASTTHYVISDTAAGSYAATPLETLNTGYLVTAADKAPGAKMAVLLGYKGSLPYDHFMTVLSDFSDGYFFTGNRRKLSLPNAGEMGQAEGITFRNATYGYISNEKIDQTFFGTTIKVKQKLRSFSIDAFLPAYVLPLKLEHFTVTKTAGQHNVAWQFSEPVQNLRVQYSSNRIDFSTVQTFAASTKGFFSYLPQATINCYRLVWKDASGADHFSDIITLKEKGKNKLSRLVLRNDGELSFLLDGSQPATYTFRLLSTDGKLVAQTQSQSMLPGANKIRFRKSLAHSSIVLLQAVNAELNESLLLKVE